MDDGYWDEYNELAGSKFALSRDRFEAHVENEIIAGGNMEKFLDAEGILLLFYEEKMLLEGYQGVRELLEEYGPHLLVETDVAAIWCNENPLNGEAVVRSMQEAMEFPPPPHKVQQLLDMYSSNAQEHASRSDDYRRIHMFLRKLSLGELFSEDESTTKDIAKVLATRFFHHEKWNDLYAFLLERIRTKYPRREIELAPLLNMISSRTGTGMAGAESTVFAANSTSTHDEKGIHIDEEHIHQNGDDIVVPIPSVAASSVALLHTTREDWLRKNARIGRLYNLYSRNCFKGFELASLSPGFRFYLTIWLVAGAVQLYLYFIHFMGMVSWRIFVPVVSDYWHAVGYFCILVAQFFFIGPALTTVAKTVYQWVYVDDMIWYGDDNWSEKWLKNPEKQKRYDPRDGHFKNRAMLHGDETLWNNLEHVDAVNPVPSHLLHVLPPVYRATVWGLPVNSMFPKSFIFISLFVLTVPVPLIYALVKLIVEGQGIISISGYFCEWCALVGLCTHVFIMIFTWALGLATKYGEFYRHRKNNSESQRNGTPPKKITSNQLLMAELALDAETVMSNLAVFLVTYAAIMMLYWLTSTSEVEFPLKWIVTVLVSFLLLLVIREILRDDHLATRVALLVLTLVVGFEIFGIVATAKISTSTLIIFAILIIFSQGLLAAHRAKPMINVDPLVFSSAVTEKCTQLLEHSNPRDEGKVPMSKVQSAIRKVATKTGRTSHTQPSWVPASKILSALLRWNQDGSGEPSSPMTPSPRSKLLQKRNRHWLLTPEYYGGEVYGDRYNNPRRKIQQQLSVRVLFWFLLVCIVSAGIVLASASYYKQPKAIPILDLGTVPRKTYNYPACSAQFGDFTDKAGNGFTITDMAYLSYVGYISSIGKWDAEVRDSIFNAQIILLPSTTNLFFFFNEELGEKNNPQAEGGLINWVHVHRADVHVITIRSNLVGKHLMRDIDIWGDSILFSVLSSLFPFIKLFSDDQKRDWISGLSSLKEALDNKGSNHYFSPIIKYINTVQTRFPNSRIILTGHGTNGGIANIVGSLLNIKSIAFGSPGTSLLRKKLSLFANPYSLTILPDSNFFGSIDEQVWVFFYQCSPPSSSSCRLPSL